MYSKPKFTDERVVPEEDRSKEKYYGHLIFYNFALKIAESKLVLDDGCGTGYGSAFLLQAQPIEVIGMDISVDAIVYATQRYKHPRLTYIVGDGRALPFASKTFDFVTSSQVIEHIADYEAYLSEIVRVLKDDGILLIGTPNKQTFNPHEAPMPFHFKEFYMQEFLELMRRFLRRIEVLGQYNVKRSKRRAIRNLLIRLGQSLLLSWIPIDARVKVGRALAKMFTMSENYSLADFRIQTFDPSTSMNIICICSLKR